MAPGWGKETTREKRHEEHEEVEVAFGNSRDLAGAPYNSRDLAGASLGPSEGENRQEEAEAVEVAEEARVGNYEQKRRRGVGVGSGLRTFLTMTSQGTQALLIDVRAARREPERAIYLALLWTRWFRRPFLLGPLLRSKNSTRLQGATALGALGRVWAPALWLEGARPTRVGLAVGLLGATASIVRDHSWKGVLAGINAGATVALGNNPVLAGGGGPGWGISHGANLGLAARVLSGGTPREGTVSTLARGVARLMVGVGDLLINDGLLRRHL